MTSSVTVTVTSDTLADALAALGLQGGTGTGTGTGTGGTGGGTTTPPVILQQSDFTAAVPLNYVGGTGPDQITFMLNSGGTNSFNVLFNGHVVAEALTPAAGGNISYTINGTFGAPAAAGTDTLTWTPAGGSGLSGMVMLSASYLSTTYTSGALWFDVPVAASADYSGWSQARVWDQAGVAFGAGFAPTGTGTGGTGGGGTGTGNPPPTTDSTISGATINTAATPPAILSAMAALVPSGGTLQLPAGTFVGTTAFGAGTLTGAGPGQTIINALGRVGGLTQGKGIIVPTAPGMTISNMTIEGATTSDLNGAGIRDAGDSIGFSLNNVEVTGNQNGILTFASNINITNCNFHDNGANLANTGQTFSVHEMYIGEHGDPTKLAMISGTNVTVGAGSTHAIHCRIPANIFGGTWIGNKNTDPNGFGGSVFDFPNMGNISITDVTCEQHGGGGNNVFLSYGMEAADSLVVVNNTVTDGFTLTLTNWLFKDFTGTGGFILCGSGSWTVPGLTSPVVPSAIAKLVLVNCKFDPTNSGGKAPTIQGFASVVGTITSNAATPPPPTVSPDKTIITIASGGSVVTAAGTWTFGAARAGNTDLNIVLNGTPVAGYASVMEVANGGQLYVQTAAGLWFLWNTSTSAFVQQTTTPTGL